MNDQSGTKYKVDCALLSLNHWENFGRHSNALLNDPKRFLHHESIMLDKTVLASNNKFFLEVTVDILAPNQSGNQPIAPNGID